MPINYPRRGRTGWKRFVPSWKLVLGTAATLALAGAVALVTVFAYGWYTIDIPEENEVAVAQTTIVYYNDGKTEIARIGDTNRISIPISDIPDDVQKAVLSAEDRQFYEHAGFSPAGFARALLTNIQTGSSQGGSTITQQYAKNAYLNADKTYARKFRELLLSLKLENQLTKDEILERYLNTIFFGRGAYGIETAAEAYFGKDAKDLTLEQGAVLAAIINAPGAFSPEDNLERLKARYEYVLNGMVEAGWLTPERRDEAMDNFPDIRKRQRGQRYGGQDGYLLTMVEKEALAKGFTESELYGGGLRITSTFDKQAQDAAVRAVREKGPTTNTEGLRIGLASVEPVTGEVVAIYGGDDYLEDSLNNATQAIAQAGSTFKPFALVAATDQGIGPYSRWPGNSPTTTDGYTYENYGNRSYGSAVTLAYGTEQSINSVFVTLESEVGIDEVRKAALDSGIPQTTSGWEESDNLTFVLGTASPHAMDVATAYATFAGRGQRATTTTIREIRTDGGKSLYKRAKTQVKALDENTADMVNWYLQRVVQNGTGKPALALGRPAAGKTGSTDSYMSAWFAGYTPQLATAVMFAKEDAEGNPVSLNGTGGMPSFYGGGFPAQVWTAYMRGALQGEPVEQFAAPEELPSGGNSPSTSGSASESASPGESVSGSPSGSGTAEPTQRPTSSAGPTKSSAAPSVSTPAPEQSTPEPQSSAPPQTKPEPSSPEPTGAQPSNPEPTSAKPTPSKTPASGTPEVSQSVDSAGPAGEVDASASAGQ